MHMGRRCRCNAGRAGAGGIAHRFRRLYAAACFVITEQISLSGRAETLQRAMGRNDFYGLRTEWWHFTAQDWKNYVRYQDVQVTGQSPKAGPDGKL